MPKNEIFQTKNLVRLALVAALYAALTLALPGLSFGAIQFRFSEILVLLCFYSWLLYTSDAADEL